MLTYWNTMPTWAKVTTLVTTGGLVYVAYRVARNTKAIKSIKTKVNKHRKPGRPKKEKVAA